MSWRTSAAAARKHRPDYLLILVTGLLLLLGLIIIYSISPVLSHKLQGNVNANHFLYGQLTHIGVGLIALWGAAHIPFYKWQQYLPWLVVGSGLALLLLMIPGLGSTHNGATRWVDLGPLSFQPAELLKLTLVLLMANRFAKPVADELESRRALKTALGVIGIFGVLVLFLQKDMGTMLILVAILVAQFYASGVRLRYVGTLLGLGLLMGVLAIAIFPHRIARLLTYLDPSQNQETSSYHLNQALIAIGSGGFTGLGIGKSIQVYGYLPEAANDSIFAIIGETVGFFGAFLVVLLFGALLYRGLKVALGAPDRYARLLAMGIVAWVGAQAVVNMMAMLGLIPLTGVPLPFLSYGGTSLVVMLGAIGILINISKYTERRAHAHSFVRRGNRRAPYAYS